MSLEQNYQGIIKQLRSLPFEHAEIDSNLDVPSQMAWSFVWLLPYLQSDLYRSKEYIDWKNNLKRLSTPKYSIS